MEEECPWRKKIEKLISRVGRLLGTQKVAFRHLSVRLLSIVFQSSFGSAEFGKRFMQCAKRNIFLKNFNPSRSVSLYAKKLVDDIDLHICVKMKLTPTLTLEKS